MPMAILTVGLPGSGKSTYASKLDDWFNINRDELRRTITGDERDRSREGAVHMRLAQAIAAAARRGQNVVVSDTNAHVGARRNLIKFLRKVGFTRVEAHIMDVSADVCRRRNADRPNPVPEAAMALMEARLRRSPPSLAEGFDEIVTVRQGGVAPFYDLAL